MKFSFVIPYYRKYDYIVECLNSIIAQTYKNWEVILVNDGDEESLIKPVLDYFNDKRIKYFYKKNSGVGDTRNYGNSKATGDWIVIQDADDYSFPERLQLTLNKIKEGNCDMVSGGSYWSANDMRFIKEYWQPRPVNRESLLKLNQGVLHTALAYSKKVALETPYRKVMHNDDFFFIVDCWNKNYKVCLLDKPLSIYRILNDGISTTKYKIIQKELKQWKKDEGKKLRVE